MSIRTCLIGFDAPDAAAVAARLFGECVAHEMLPRVVVERGNLFVPGVTSAKYLRVDRVVFHGIFERDLETLAGLALWGGPCFPDPVAMMDCRLRLPGLVKALKLTRFGGRRDFASAGADYDAAGDTVAKWGNWHCGENKERFTGTWTAVEPTLFEPFTPGEAVRVIVLGDNPPRQIRLAGTDWRKSVHAEGAAFMPLDPELAADTLAIQRGLNLSILANDYIVGPAGPYLLEVNHIPSVNSHPELWAEYLDVVAVWAAGCG